VDVAGVEPKRVPAEVVGGVGPAPNRGTAGVGAFGAVPNMPVEAGGAVDAPEPNMPPDDAGLLPKSPPPVAGAVPVDAPAPNALTVVLGADEAGVVFSFGLPPKLHPVPVVPDPNRFVGGFACVAPVAVADPEPKRPGAEDAGAF
jgi:hypothetical protein